MPVWFQSAPGKSPAPAPGLHHDYGQITTSVALLVFKSRTCVEATWEAAGAGESRRQLAGAGAGAGAGITS